MGGVPPARLSDRYAAFPAAARGAARYAVRARVPGPICRHRGRARRGRSGARITDSRWLSEVSVEANALRHTGKRSLDCPEARLLGNHRGSFSLDERFGGPICHVVDAGSPDVSATGGRLAHHTIGSAVANSANRVAGTLSDAC